MKKLASLFLAALIVSALTGAAFSAEAPALYPVEVTEYDTGGNSRLNKVYALSAGDDPANIPTADFTRDGIAYTLLDMTKQDQTASDTKPHSETVTVSSKSKETDKVLALLTPTQDVTTEDGYTGVLTLDTASIAVVAAGYGSSSRTVTATRSYPNLSDADTSFVPKTTEDNGRTLELTDVQWQEAGGFYHATATYTGTATSKYVTGYIVTASYTGEVSKTTDDMILYTAIFGGTSIQPVKPAEITTLEAAEAAPLGNGWKWLLILPVGACAAGLGYLGVFLNKKYKAKKDWKEYTK